MNRSIERRLLLSSLIVLVAFLGLAAIVLDQAFRSATEDAAREQLQALVFTLLAAADTDDQGRMRLPGHLAAPDFNRPRSGLYAQVYGEDAGYQWHSASLLGQPMQPVPSIEPGMKRFRFGSDLATFDQGIDWEDDDGRPVGYTLRLSMDTSAIERQRAGFRATLWRWFGGITLLLLAVLVVLIRWGLRPLHRMSEAVRRLEQGESSRIEGPVVRELQGLSDNLNALIELSDRRQARVRNSLADLAHSMKTPLTVLRGATDSVDDPAKRQLLVEQTRRIDELVSYQRQRAAVAGSSAVTGSIAPRPILERLCASLQKVHQDRGIDCDIQVDPADRLRVDEGDLFELMGNLVENAFKHCEHQVLVSLQPGDKQSRISVEDDGPGIDEADAERLLQRGERADRHHPGDGIGLAVVDEIVRQYNGRLEIGRSTLGGASLQIQLPR